MSVALQVVNAALPQFVTGAAPCRQQIILSVYTEGKERRGGKGRVGEGWWWWEEGVCGGGGEGGRWASHSTTPL